MLHLAQQTLQNKQAPNIQRACNILQSHLRSFVSLFLYVPFQMQVTSQLTLTKNC